MQSHSLQTPVRASSRTLNIIPSINQYEYGETPFYLQKLVKDEFATHTVSTNLLDQNIDPEFLGLLSYRYQILLMTDLYKLYQSGGISKNNDEITINFISNEKAKLHMMALFRKSNETEELSYKYNINNADDFQLHDIKEINSITTEVSKFVSKLIELKDAKNRLEKAEVNLQIAKNDLETIRNEYNTLLARIKEVAGGEIEEVGAHTEIRLNEAARVTKPNHQINASEVITTEEARQNINRSRLFLSMHIVSIVGAFGGLLAAGHMIIDKWYDSHDKSSMNQSIPSLVNTAAFLVGALLAASINKQRFNERV